MATSGLVRGILWGVLLLAPVLSATSLRASADGEEPKKEAKPVVDATRVYYGKANGCKAPAVVDADRVFAVIPEYRKIQEQKLTEKDPEYSILMLRANKRFRAAVESAAVDGACDLVAGVGAVSWDGHVIPEITDAAIQKVGEQK